MLPARALALLVLGLGLAATAASAQPVAPPDPATVLETPAWSRTIRLADGRVFVTDGGFALEAALARPKTMPPEIQGPQGAQALAGHLALANPTDAGLAELKTGTRKNSFVAPNGLELNGNYIGFLRRVAPAARLKMKGPMDPIVVVLDGKVIGVFMPLRQ